MGGLPVPLRADRPARDLQLQRLATRHRLGRLDDALLHAQQSLALAQAAPYFLATAILLPTLALAGYLAAGKEVMQHLQDPVGALRQMRGITRPGGLVAVRDAEIDAAL
mgnify:CR=1 FL=1